MAVTQTKCTGFYLCQVNEVNGGDNAFVRCVSVCLSVCLCAAADFKFDTHVPRDSLDVIPKNFPKRGRGHDHVTP